MDGGGGAMRDCRARVDLMEGRGGALAAPGGSGVGQDKHCCA
jgi:hypothetical protein